ncbi:MAG: SIS domain-containing protein, partial [Bdellovibrionales bacterium]
DRTPLPAFAMTVDTSLLTAIGNDYGYNDIFSRQVEGLMGPQDVFWGITTSGNSPNLVEAYQMCRNKNVKSILLTGPSGGLIKKQELADVVIQAPGAHTARIQECHIAIYHCLCFLTEKSLVESGHIQYRNKK